jgi:hypothetical protein
MDGSDIALIQNLLNHVMIAMDKGDGAAFSSCFTSDGVCDVVLSNAHSVGTAQLEKFCEGIHEKFPTCRHWEGNVAVSPINGSQGQHATNVSYWKALDGCDIVSMGIHEDTLHRTEAGVWKIASRQIVHTWTAHHGHIKLK